MLLLGVTISIINSIVGISYTDIALSPWIPKGLNAILKHIVLKSRSWDTYKDSHFGVVIWAQMYSTLPRVVWAKESKTGLRFEIGPSYDDIPTKSQLVTDGQSSCTLLDYSFILMYIANLVGTEQLNGSIWKIDYIMNLGASSGQRCHTRGRRPCTPLCLRHAYSSRLCPCVRPRCDHIHPVPIHHGSMWLRQLTVPVAEKLITTRAACWSLDSREVVISRHLTTRG